MSDGLTRRRFLRSGSLAALAGSVFATTANSPASAAGRVRSGSAAAWQAPLSGTISGTQDYDAGFEVPAGTTLRFDPDVSTTVTVRANVIVYGTLEMKPANASIVHKLVFDAVDESLFEGGGTDPAPDDTGLWVMGAGRLDLAGAEKQAWNRTGDHASWSSSDELVVTPTAAGDYTFRSHTRGSAVPTVANPYGGEAAYLEPSSLAFSDIFGNTHTANIESIAAAGITRGCTTVLYCPNHPVTRGQMAAFLNRALGLPAAPSAGFSDTIGHTFADEINRVAAAGITLGTTATTYAPDEVVSRAQMASFLARAFDLPVPDLGNLTDGTAFRAEILNLTRNVRIEGTASGKTHIFIRSSAAQSIRYVAIRYVAPDFKSGSVADVGPIDATGRYGIHFHHCGDGSRGTTVEGCVVRDADGHAFVPHMSHGITMVNCISYNTRMDAYWWDEGKANQTDDIIWDKCVAAGVGAGPNHNPHRVGGFALQFGDRNVVTNCVAVGVGGSSDSAGFKWPEFANNSVWTWGSNVSHNNLRSGLFTWQNDTRNHDVGFFTSYHNGLHGINHGAYFNEYFYHDAVLYGNAGAGVILKAVNHLGTSAALRFERLVIDGAGITPTLVINGQHTGAAENIPLPTKFTDCTMLNETDVKVKVKNVRQDGGIGGQGFKDRWDFVNCGMQVADIYFTADADPESLVRAQNGSSAFEVDVTGSRTISPFA